MVRYKKTAIGCAAFIAACAMTIAALASGDDDWAEVGRTADAAFHIQVSSLSNENATSQFILRVSYFKPIVLKQKPVSTMFENTVVLCEEQKLITTVQLGYNTVGEHIFTNTKSQVFKSIIGRQDVVAVIINTMCAPVEPENEKPSRPTH